MTNLIDLIKEKYPKLSKGKKLLADFIMSSYDQAAFLTAAALGNRVGISESTVVRFASDLGLGGYPELQQQLRQMLKSHLTTVQRADMAVGMARSDAVKSILSRDSNDIRETLENMDYAAFDGAVDAILCARRIYVLGLRSAMPLAQYLSYYLDFVCDNVLFINGAVQNIRERMVRLNKEDVLIGISFPRYDAKTIGAMNEARAHGATVVTFTDRKDGPAGRAADIALCAKTSMASYADSMTAPLSLINSLLVAIGLSRSEEAKLHMQQLEDVWREEETYL